MATKLKLNAKSGCTIGLTGGIGTGKSHLLSCFKKLGFKTFDTDKAVHDLFKKGNEGYEKVGKVFPDSLGKLRVNKRKLSAHVLSSKSALKKLEEIIHPLVRQKQEEFQKKYKDLSIVFEVPLLFENKREKHYDYIFSTVVDEKTQKKRCSERKGMTSDKFDAILSRQVSREIHHKKADFVVDTSGTKQQTFKKVKALIEDE